MNICTAVSLAVCRLPERMKMMCEVTEMKELIERINQLYHKSQAEGLTEEEKDEQARLRREYIDNVKANFRTEMAGVKKIDPPSH